MEVKVYKENIYKHNFIYYNKWVYRENYLILFGCYEPIHSNIFSDNAHGGSTPLSS